MIVTAACLKHSAVDLLSTKKKTITAEVTPKDLHFTVSILHLLELGIEKIVICRQTTSSGVLLTNVLLVENLAWPTIKLEHLYSLLLL